MPTYAYACTACEHTFEVVQSFSDDSLTVCPECGDRLRKVYNAVGVVFKGSGFYRTDSRAALRSGDGSSDNGKAGKDSGEKGSSDKGSSGKGASDKGSSSGSSGAGSKPAGGSSSTGSSSAAAKSTAST